MKREEIEAGIRKAYELGEIDLAKRLMAELEAPEVKEKPKARAPFRELTTRTPFMMGFSDPAAGIAQFASKFTSPSTQQMVAQSIAEREKAYEAPEGFDIGRTIGNIVNPVSLALMGVPAGQATLLPRMAAGAGAGGAYAGAMPTTDKDFWRTKTGQIGAGAGFGAAIPVGTAVGGGALRLADQLTRPLAARKAIDTMLSTKVTPIQRDIIDRISDTLGAGKERVIQALREATPFPHQRRVTAGQVLGRANLEDEARRFGGPVAGLEAELSRIPEGGLSDKAQTIYKGQRAARRKVLDELSGTDAQMAKLEEARSAIVTPYYDAVDEATAPVDSASVIAQIDELIARNPLEDKVTKPLYTIRDKLVQGEDIVTDPKSLRSLSKDIGDKIQAKTPTGQSEYNVQALISVKNTLDQNITRAVPEYETAQRIYAEQSAPISQMKVARALTQKIDAADIKQESVRPFLTAAKAEAKLIKAATGFKRGKSLETIFKGNEQGLKDLKNVISDLDANVEAAKMSSELGSVFGGIKTGIEVQAPSVLEREVVLANYILSRIGKDKTGEFAEVAWGLIEDPKYMADLLELPGGYPMAREVGKRLRQMMITGTAAQEA